MADDVWDINVARPALHPVMPACTHEHWFYVSMRGNATEDQVQEIYNVLRSRFSGDVQMSVSKQERLGKDLTPRFEERYADMNRFKA